MDQAVLCSVQVAADLMALLIDFRQLAGN